MAIPAGSLDAIEIFCEMRVPEEIRDEIRVESVRRGSAITIFELRPPWRDDLGPEWTRMKVAQLRHSDSAGTWTLYWPDRNGRWHRYDDLEPSRSVDPLLAEIDADPTGIFWG